MRATRSTVVLAVLVALPACAYDADDPTVAEEEVALETKGFEARRVAIHVQMERLFADQVAQNHAATVSVLADLEDTEVALARLEQSQTRFANTIGAWYGPVARARLLELLNRDFVLGTKWLKALREGKADERLREERMLNAAETVNLLGKLMPTLNTGEVRGLWVGLLDQEMAQGEARAAKDWKGDLAAADQAALLGGKLADRMAKTIILQFPNWFGPAGPGL